MLSKVLEVVTTYTRPFFQACIIFHNNELKYQNVSIGSCCIGGRERDWFCIMHQFFTFDSELYASTVVLYGGGVKECLGANQVIQKKRAQEASF